MPSQRGGGKGLGFSRTERKPLSPGVRTGTAPLSWEPLSCRVLALEGKMVSDHGDEFRIRGFSLDAADRVAEEFLKGLHVAAPSANPAVCAVFRDFRPEKLGAFWKVFSLKSMNVVYSLVCWFEYLLFIALLSLYSASVSETSLLTFFVHHGTSLNMLECNGTSFYIYTRDGETLKVFPSFSLYNVDRQLFYR